MAVPAVDCAHGELMPKRAFKAGPHRRMALGAERVARSFHVGTVYAVALGARDAVLCVWRLEPVGLPLVGRVAAQAGTVDCVRLPARKDGKLGRIERLDMGQSRTMACLAGAALVHITGERLRLRFMTYRATV